MKTNQAYKKVIVILRNSYDIKDEDVRDMFALAGLTPSSTQLKGWSAGEDSRYFRAMKPEELTAFLDGAIAWTKQNNNF